jgi:hypothetical protein
VPVSNLIKYKNISEYSKHISYCVLCVSSLFLRKHLYDCFSVSTQQDTAAAGADYTSLTNSVLTFTPGGTTLQHITVNIIDDDLIEGTERFTASLSTTSPLTKIGNINETIVRITDNDGTQLETDWYIF